jgi:hypothetical protein
VRTLLPTAGQHNLQCSRTVLIQGDLALYDSRVRRLTAGTSKPPDTASPTTIKSTRDHGLCDKDCLVTFTPYATTIGAPEADSASITIRLLPSCKSSGNVPTTVPLPLVNSVSPKDLPEGAIQVRAKPEELNPSNFIVN